MTAHFANFGSGDTPPTSRPEVFPTMVDWPTWPEWARWALTGGDSGEEPPAEVKRLLEIGAEIPKATTSEERNALFKEAFRIHSQNLWIIGTIREPGKGTFTVVTNRFRNIPEIAYQRNIDFSQCYIAQ